MRNAKPKLFILAFALAALPQMGGAVEIAPASASDILAALGPDARGLSIHQDSLPDLFTLTSSRIDENATRFIIEERYLGGHWKDGKAVIEFARDLSYTIVSIYDKAGRRQRIYSVRSKYAEHIAQTPVQSEEPAARARAQEPDLEVVQQPAARESRTETYRKSTTVERAPESVSTAAGAAEAYEWDEAKGDYVPAGSAGAAARESARAAQEQPRETARALQTQPREVVQAERTPEPEPISKRSSRRRRYRQSSASASKSGDSGAVVTAAGTKWVERKEVSVPEEKAVQEPPKKSTKKSRPVEQPPAAKAAAEPVREQPRREEVVVAKTYTPPAGTVREPINIDEESVPSTEELITGEAPASKQRAQAAAPEEIPEASPAPAKPLSADGDAWVPSKVKTQEYREPALPKETKQVAMVPNVPSVNDAYLNAPVSKEPVTQAGDSWVPSKTGGDGLTTEAQLNKEIKRVREEEKQKKAIAAKPMIRRDVNNPEEGVLPVSSFEKFTGSMYGRHREYERRFYPGKKSKSKAPDHDFYVDEVDRKKEIHNIYFYQHRTGKAPKLVAVQKHDKVTFRSNYDIDKEDSGKLSTYN